MSRAGDGSALDGSRTELWLLCPTLVCRAERFVPGIGAQGQGLQCGAALYAMGRMAVGMQEKYPLEGTV